MKKQPYSPNPMNQYYNVNGCIEEVVEPYPCKYREVINILYLICGCICDRC